METIFIRNLTVLYQNAGISEAILYDTQTGMLHVINPTASRVWELIDGRRSLQAIGTCLAEEYNCTENLPAIIEDVRVVLEDFVQKQLITHT